MDSQRIAVRCSDPYEKDDICRRAKDWRSPSFNICVEIRVTQDQAKTAGCVGVSAWSDFARHLRQLYRERAKHLGLDVQFGGFWVVANKLTPHYAEVRITVH